MPQVSTSLKKRLLDQEKEMDTGGLFIRSKDFTKARLRILPAGEEVPGARFISYYCDALDGKTKSVISPETYQKPCPIADALNNIKTTGDKSERERAFNYVNRIAEYWMKVVKRKEEGEGKHPNIRIFPAKRTVYKEIVRWMSDDDIGEDITDPEEGCDILVKKEGSGRDTKWHTDKMRTSALCEDEELYEAILERNEEMDVRTYFQQVDWELLAEVYEGLTGEELPDSYQEEFDDADKDAGQSEESEEEEEGEEGEEGEEEEDDEWVEGETIVTFEDDDGGEIEGTYIGLGKNDDGEDDEEYGEIEDADGEVWTVAFEDLTILVDEEEETEDEPEDEPDDEPEPEEAPPRRRRRAARQPEKPAKKAGSKKKTLKKASAASSTIRNKMSKASKAAASKKKKSGTKKAAKKPAAPKSKKSGSKKKKTSSKKPRGRRG